MSSNNKREDEVIRQILDETNSSFSDSGNYYLFVYVLLNCIPTINF